MATLGKLTGASAKPRGRKSRVEKRLRCLGGFWGSFFGGFWRVFWGVLDFFFFWGGVGGFCFFEGLEVLLSWLIAKSFRSRSVYCISRF